MGCYDKLRPHLIAGSQSSTHMLKTMTIASQRFIDHVCTVLQDTFWRLTHPWKSGTRSSRSSVQPSL